MKMIFLFLIFSISISARTVKSYVYDIDNSPLGQVEVKNIKSGDTFLSDSMGYFTIEGDDTDTIAFMLSGFTTTEMTIINILNSNNKIYLFHQLEYILPEVVVMPANMYEIYEKSVYNLKNKMIKNKKISYNCERLEKEINFGDERTLTLLFAAKAENVNPKKSKLDYKILLSKLDVTLGTQTSKIIKDNKLYDNNFFLSNLPAKIPKCKDNSIQFLDSTIVIFSKFYLDYVVKFTINKIDTTLIKFEYKLLSNDNKKYRQLRTFKVKMMYYSTSVELKKNDDGYFMYEKVVNYDYSFLVGQPKVEERVVCLLKISAMTEPLTDATLEIKLDTRQLYNMGNYPLVPDKH